MRQFDVFRDENGDEYATLNKSYLKNINEEKYNLLLKKSCIPKFYWDVEFKDYKGTSSKKEATLVQKISENIHNEKYKDLNLYLWSSENGSQKTALACNFGKECIRQGLRVKFLLFKKFIDLALKLQGFSRDENLEALLLELKRADIIILDDCFDPEKSVMWKQNGDLITAEIDSFLRELIYNNKRFVMTSNLPIGEVEKIYGRSLYALLERNFVQLQFLDSVRELRKQRLSKENLFEDFNL